MGWACLMLSVVSLLFEGTGGAQITVLATPSSYRQIWPKQAAIGFAARFDADVGEIGCGLVRNGIK